MEKTPHIIDHLELVKILTEKDGDSLLAYFVEMALQHHASWHAQAGTRAEREARAA